MSLRKILFWGEYFLLMTRLSISWNNLNESLIIDEFKSNPHRYIHYILLPFKILYTYWQSTYYTYASTLHLLISSLSCLQQPNPLPLWILSVPHPSILHLHRMPIYLSLLSSLQIQWLKLSQVPIKFSALIEQKGMHFLWGGGERMWKGRKYKLSSKLQIRKERE